MKKTLKISKDLLLSNLLLILMMSLHLGVYEGRANGNLRDLLSVLMVQTDSPVDVHELLLCEQESKRPSYLHPFQALEYHYQVIFDEKAGEYSDCAIVEKADSIWWKADLEPVSGNPIDYWGGDDSDEGPFARPLVDAEVPNVLYFFIQYGLLATWIAFLFKPIKK